jgi:hypothetical protein
MPQVSLRTAVEWSLNFQRSNSVHKIQKNPWGFELTFADTMDAREMQMWLEESKSVLKTAQPGFGIFVDMRALKPLAPDAQAIMQEGQKLYKAKGMVRSVVILASGILTMQFKRIAHETGIYDWERYIDSTEVPTWREKGIAWVKDKGDPHKK